MWVIAHRGASAFAPENTLAAFERAMGMGAGFVEADLHLSRDARLVVVSLLTSERVFRRGIDGMTLKNNN